jgi:LPXTG-motif cell wall-anchored protein
MSWTLMAVGLALTVGAGVMGARRKRHLTLDILSGAPELQPDGRGGRLLTEGPYAVIRHPRYVEVALAVFGYAFLSNHLGAYIMALLTIPVIHLIVLLEERELARRFGSAWEEYLARVPRYIPRRRAV